MEEESNRELAFLDTSLKRNNGEISLLAYRKPTHTEHKLLCKANDQVATEDKNNVVYEIDCSNCPSVYFGE